MDITTFIVPLLLVILGIIIRSGKASSLIAGFNTASAEEKAKYDVLALSQFVGNLLFLIAGMFIFRAFAIFYELDFLSNIMLIGFVIVIIMALIFMNTGIDLKTKVDFI